MASKRKPSPAAVNRKVLIAVDNSKWAETSFDWYVKYAHQKNTEVIIFHAVSPPWILSGETVGLSAEAFTMSPNGLEPASTVVENKFREKMNSNNISGRVVVKMATRPGEAIVDAAKQEAVTMIVIGSRGLGVLRRTILGSVSDFVLHHAHCPVVVCSHHPHKPKTTASA